MSTLRKRNQHTPPSEHVAATGGKSYTPDRIMDMAHSCGLYAAQMKVGGTWDWYISLMTGGGPCFQGQGHEAALWLQGYQRCIENHKE